METLTDASMVELEDNLKWMQPCGCNPVDATMWMPNWWMQKLVDTTLWMELSRCNNQVTVKLTWS
ncbi:hypothetical protein F2Q69_00029847 [Brassica cretica]|uniref:Uncharacterized protein n=1 Tax=Brassica cretica TaxID=69181 RepID=A0A8S9S9H2_BRACR|nr:hypothetical protein F2Q69_00029847 [Brassica cretica]